MPALRPSQLVAAAVVRPLALLALSVSLQAVAAQTGTDATSTADIEPAHVITDTCAQPVYPKEAFAANQTGTVLLSIQVSAEGKALKTDIAESSGNAQLDAAAATGMGQCSFKPARQNGVSVESTAVLKYTFRIDTTTAEQAAAQQKMKAVVAILSMQRKVDAIAERCSLQDGSLGRDSKKAALQWHRRNDASVNKAEQVKNAAFDEFRSKSADTQLADQQIEKSRAALESIVERSAALELSHLAGNTRAEETGPCDDFKNATFTGQFDLAKIFPEFVTLMDTATQPTAVAPSAAN